MEGRKREGGRVLAEVGKTDGFPCGGASQIRIRPRRLNAPLIIAACAAFVSRRPCGRSKITLIILTLIKFRLNGRPHHPPLLPPLVVHVGHFLMRNNEAATSCSQRKSFYLPPSLPVQPAGPIDFSQSHALPLQKFGEGAREASRHSGAGRFQVESHP